MDDRRRDGGTNTTLRTKEQGTHLTLNEHDDDDDDDDDGIQNLSFCNVSILKTKLWIFRGRMSQILQTKN